MALDSTGLSNIRVDRRHREYAVRLGEFVRDVWFREGRSQLLALQDSAYDSRLERLEADLLHTGLEGSLKFKETDGTVDFRVTHGKDGKERFFLEATVCGINTGVLHSSVNEEDAVRKIRGHLANPHSHVWLSATGELCKTLGKQRLITPIRELLESCTADEVRRLQGENAWQRPRTSIKEGDWRLDVSLSPPIALGGGGQVWGPSRCDIVNGATPLENSLSKKAEDWKKKELRNEVFLTAVNVCHSEFDWSDDDTSDIERALFSAGDGGSITGCFRDKLRRINGVLVVGNAVLGNERSARVRIFRNEDRNIPKCLHFLTDEQRLGQLLGIGS